MKYTIVDYFGYDLSPAARMKAIKQAGFDGVILLWADYFDADYKKFPEYASLEGLFVENAHAPYLPANTVWQDTEDGRAYTENIISCLKDCAENGVPTLVIHAGNGTEALEKKSLATGLYRFEKMTEAAEKFNVNLAVENQGNSEYVGAVLDNIFSEKLRFCFDSGHENFYSPTVNLLDLYGERLCALHLHDNDGTEDAHKLPFSGNINWQKISKKLTELRYTGAIALETLNKGFEEISDPVEFLSLALSRAKMIL